MTQIAIFDYDHTLITKDSFWPFLIFSAGRAATLSALALSLAAYARARLTDPQTASLRTFVKSEMIRRLLKGQPRDNLRAAAERTRLWQTMNAPILAALRDHHAAGAKILIASGSLDLYLPELLRDIPHDAILCTDIGVENGIVTGEMTHGNCVRLRKAERVAAWLGQNGPFDTSFAYGNYPHDVPMLNLVQHRIIVS